MTNEDKEHMESCSKTACTPKLSTEMKTALLTYLPSNHIEYRTSGYVIIDILENMVNIANQYGNEDDKKTVQYLYDNNFDQIEFLNV